MSESQELVEQLDVRYEQHGWRLSRSTTGRWIVLVYQSFRSESHVGAGDTIEQAMRNAILFDRPPPSASD